MDLYMNILHLYLLEFMGKTEKEFGYFCPYTGEPFTWIRWNYDMGVQRPLATYPLINWCHGLVTLKPKAEREVTLCFALTVQT